MTADPSGSGKGLTRDSIVAAALTSIDERGAQGLTMRGLGQQLGVEAMWLCRYVGGREDLLEGVVAYLLDVIETELNDTVAEGSWQGYLRALAHRMRQVVNHPNAFPVITTRRPAAPWLRPPLRSLSIVEDVLDNLLKHHFTETQAVEAHRDFSSFLLGQLLLEAAVRGAETGPVDEPLDEGKAQIPNADADVDLNSTPKVERLRRGERGPLEGEFEVGLETLLERMERSLTQRARTSERTATAYRNRQPTPFQHLGSPALNRVAVELPSRSQLGRDTSGGTANE